MSPLEHHSFRKLLSTKVQVAETAEATFTLKSYLFRYYNYFKYQEETKRWHLITMTNVSKWLLDQARVKGLLLINGIEVCVGCHTSEFVKKDKKLNLETATCTRCYRTYRGWK